MRIPLKDGGTSAVTYWGCVRNNTELLLPSALTARWTRLNPSQRAREIMKYAACLEIVPFKSNGQTGVINAEATCWNDFTRYLLELSGASVIVLVGSALNSFVSNIAPNAGGILANRNIYKCQIGGKDRYIVKVDSAQGRIRRFDRFFDNKVINQLQKVVSKCY